MKVEIKELPKHGRQLQFSIEKEAVDAERQEIVRQLAGTADIPGFRKGKVPEHIVSTRYGDIIREKLIEHLITHSYTDAVSEHKVVPVIEPEVSDVKLDGGLSFKVYVEIKPDVTVKKYKQLVVKKTAPEPVTDEAVEEVLREWEKRKEFATSIIDPEKRKAWQEKIRQQLTQMNAQKVAREEEDQLWKQMFENSDVVVPEHLMLQRARQITRDQFSHMDLQGKTQEEIEKIAQDLLEKIKPVAEDQLKKFFILEKVAEIEHLEVSGEELDESIQRLSKTSGETVEQVKKRLEESGRMEDWKDDLKVNKTFRFLRENAQMIERVVLPGEKHEPKKSR